jgi:hypothetical protein
MPRSGVAVSRGATSHRERTAPTGSEREAFISGTFGPDESVFERFGRDELASERFDGESYRVEVDRYWRRTAGRRAAAEARRADQFARADRAVSRAAGADGPESGPDRATKRAERSAARADRFAARAERSAARGERSATRGERSAVRTRRAEARSGVSGTHSSGDPALPTVPTELGAENGDPYRELLQAWARETAQEPVAPSHRTVTITGHGTEGYTTRNGTRASTAERYRQVPRHERSGFQPDRVAMWAVLLGMLMVLAAAASAHAAVVAHHVLALH